jgi:hypothetical protein
MVTAVLTAGDERGPMLATRGGERLGLVTCLLMTGKMLLSPY